VGLNMTRIGVDPALYSTLSPCQSMFSDIFFASRSSASFTSSLQDFVTPLTFLRPPVMDYSVKGDTLRCNRATGTISLTNNSTVGVYTWKAIGGSNITGANGDSSQLTVNKAGTYIVSASPAQGCPATRTDTIVVPIDTSRPVASATAGMSGSNLLLYGGDVSASNYPTPFGGSQGLNFNWSGPGNFSSTVQNPVTDTVWGTYNLTVTEKRNGCTATAATTVSAAMFTILLAEGLQLQGNYNHHTIGLGWEDLDQSIDQSFVIERSDGINDFQPIGIVWNGSGYLPATPGSFSFTDEQPLGGNNFYRIKAVTTSGETYYSRTVMIAAGSALLQSIYIRGNDQSDLSLVVNTTGDYNGLLAEYSIAGQVLGKKSVSFVKGSNTVSLPVTGKCAVHVLALFIDGRVAWVQKVIF
jgi:hypothetical protein